MKDMKSLDFSQKMFDGLFYILGSSLGKEERTVKTKDNPQYEFQERRQAKHTPTNTRTTGFRKKRL